MATCIQHEMDHLEGILFIDHLSRLKKQMALKKLDKLRKAAEVTRFEAVLLHSRESGEAQLSEGQSWQSSRFSHSGVSRFRGNDDFCLIVENG